MSREKILLISDSIQGPTGFANNGSSVAWMLSKEYDVHTLGLQSTSTNKIKLHIHGETREIIEHPNIPRSNDKWDFGAKSLPYVLDLVKPDMLITVNDIQMVQHIPNVLYKNEANIKIMDMPSRNLLPEEVIKMSVDRAIQEFKEKYPLDIKWIMAAPQDGEPPMPQWKSIYDVADQVVAFAKYGKNIFKNYYNMDVPYIYHAIDTELFVPNKKPEPLQDKFVIGNFNRNQPRKQPVRCIQAFAKFAADKPDVLLHMQMDWKDIFGWPIQYFGQMYGCLHKMIQPKPVGMPREEVAKTYNLWDINVNPHGGEGFGLCEHIDTIIHTRFESKRLKDVIPQEDYVLSRDGKYHKVLDKISRKVNELYSVKPAYTLKTLVTPEHPFLASTDGENLDWINVKDLKEGDWLFTPKAIYDNKLPNNIDISEWVASNFKTDGEYIYKEMGFSPNTELSYNDICKKYNVTKKIVEKAISYIKNDGKYIHYKKDGKRIYNIHSEDVIELVGKLLNDSEFTIPEPIKIKKNIKVDDRFLEVCGWYLAEGSTNNDTFLEFDLHSKEIEIAKFISNWIEDTFEYYGNIIEFNGENKCRLICSSSLVSEFFSRFLGSGCENKKIPWILENGGNKLGSLFKGLFFGDGHLNKKINHISLQTTSISLSTRTRDILMANGILVSFEEQKQRNGHKVPYKNIISTPYIDSFLEFIGKTPWNKPKIKRNLNIELEDGFLLKITNIELIKEEFDVMDIQVDGTHSFVSNGILAHNTTIEGSACGLPNVITDYTTSKELVIEGTPTPRGITVPPKELYWEKMDVAAVQRAAVDVDRLADAFNTYYYNRDLIKEHGEKGREWVEKNCSCNTIQHQWISLVKDVLNR